MATGEIFGWLNCDERYLPGTLQLVGRTFAEEPSLDIVFGHRVVVDKDGNEIGRMKLPAMHPGKYALYASGLLFSDTTFWTADVHRRTGRGMGPGTGGGKGRAIHGHHRFQPGAGRAAEPGCFGSLFQTGRDTAYRKPGTTIDSKN